MMVNPMLLREALSQCLGKQVTPALAEWITTFATFEVDMSHDPALFEPGYHSGYMIGVESFRRIKDELHVLHALHWLETEKHRHGLKLNPDYEAACAMERRGQLLQFTVRWHGRELVGNLRMFLQRSLHTKLLVANEDTLFIHPEHRGGMLAVALLRYAERVLRQIGVSQISANSKLVNRADVLMRRLGYQQVAHQFVKIFEETADVR